MGKSRFRSSLTATDKSLTVHDTLPGQAETRQDVIMSDKASATRARQACEPCRRKKTKCPGEKPVCSFCQRLGQICSYEKSDTSSVRVHKPRRSTSQDSDGSKIRLQRLEGRIEEVFDILNGITSRSALRAIPTSPLRPRPAEQTLIRSLTPELRTSTAKKDAEAVHFDITRFQDPPADIWSAVIEVYKNKFDHQPLSVLDDRTLSTRKEGWSRALVWSLLSLAIPFIGDHPFYRGCLTEAVSFYSKGAREEVAMSIVGGAISISTLQTACLSALREIIGSNPVGSWMNIGIGIRLALATGIMSNEQTATDQDLRNRCCWSLFALDRCYGSTLTIPPALGAEECLPPIPESAPCPNNPVDGPAQTLQIKDLGVYSNYMQLLSIWGMAMKYIQTVKNEEVEEAWTLESRYHKVMVRLFDFETKFAQIHRFQQARFQERDLATLNEQRKYWAPWLAGQLLFHTIQGLINHPFLHISSKTRQQTMKPPSFLQNSIDQAVLHSSWILKCIEVCTETGFRLNDPFMAHLVAVAATIYLFLLNAKDDELASQSRLGFERCFDFVQSMVEEWPHLQHTIDKLEILQHAAVSTSSVSTTLSAPKAQRSLLWELLDYSASTTPSQVLNLASDAVELNVDTRFLSPLNPLSTGHTPVNGIQQQHTPHAQPPPVAPPIEANWDPAMESFGFNLFDNEQMADLTNLTFGRDIWSFGQL